MNKYKTGAAAPRDKEKAMAKKKKQQPPQEKIDVNKIIALQSELDDLKRENHIEEKPGFFGRLADFYLDFTKKYDKPRTVNRKNYCWLCLLGAFGVQHFYAGHWVKGLICVAFCWTGIPIAMGMIDWMVALPKKADENGNIEI